MARKMKDSGIEWIGEIPEGWEVAPLKRFASIQTGNTPTKTSDSNYYASTGIPWIKPDNLGYSHSISKTSEYLTSEGALCARIMPPNTVYVCCIGSLGKVGYSSISCACNQQINALIFNDLMFWKYGYYLTIAQESQYLLFGNGNVLQIINSTSQGNIACVLPPLENQHLIACYLDSVCSDIEVLISKTRSSIEEYKKLKQAVITQAVTKGVRGEREMKDSGVEWIGKIPREFDPVQLKFFCKLITDGTHFSPTTVENGWPYITAGDVHGIGLDYNSAKRISEEDFQLLVAQGCQPLKGDVLLVKDGATTGRVGFVDSDTPCVILSSVAMLRPADNTDGHYLMYLLASDFLQKQILVSMAGSAMPRTTLTKLTKYIGLLSPLHEQKEIANYLDAKCAKIDGLIAKKEQLVKELESYKKSLIYEVVTGKREV